MITKYKLFENTKKLKYYEPILPKKTKKQMVDELSDGIFKDGIWEYDKLISKKKDIKKSLMKSNMNGTIHEYIHQVQMKKYPDMFGYELKISKKDWDNLEKNKVTKHMRDYLSNPPEIMAYAFSYSYDKIKKNKEHINFLDYYEQIGGEINDLFLKYVDFYINNI
jgi:hypothetical protein